MQKTQVFKSNVVSSYLLICIVAIPELMCIDALLTALTRDGPTKTV